MSYEIKPLRGPIGLSTDTDPLVYETGLQASEMALLNFVFTIDAVSGGIGALNPAVFVCEHSWDAGATWTAIPNMVLEDITAAGTFRAYASNATGLIAPNVRVYVSCPAGEEVVIGAAQRVHVSPRDSAFLSPPSIPGGVATEATLAAVLADTTAILADTNALDVALSTRATEATQLLVKAKTDNLDVALSTRATEATQLLVKAKTDNLDVALSTRATEAKQDVIIGHIDGVEAALSTRATEATQLLVKAKTDNLDVALSTRATEATQLLVKAKTDNLDVALSTRATEATAQKLREWPYATYNTQRLTQGALTDTWEFLNGVTVVGTIVITYTVANGPINNVAYSPALVV